MFCDVITCKPYYENVISLNCLTPWALPALVFVVVLGASGYSFCKKEDWPKYYPEGLPFSADWAWTLEAAQIGKEHRRISMILKHHLSLTKTPTQHAFLWETEVLYSRKFSSAKNFVKSDPQALRQEFIFVKRRSSLICSPVVRSSLFCLPFVFTFMNVSDPTLVVCEKNLVRNYI